jgi:hypothetical protein
VTLVVVEETPERTPRFKCKSFRLAKSNHPSVLLELLPGYVTLVRVANERNPLLGRQFDKRLVAVGTEAQGMVHRISSAGRSTPCGGQPMFPSELSSKSLQLRGKAGAKPEMK